MMFGITMKNGEKAFFHPDHIISVRGTDYSYRVMMRDGITADVYLDADVPGQTTVEEFVRVWAADRGEMHAGSRRYRVP